MDIAILLYEGVTAIDAVGPYEVLARVPGTYVSFVAEKEGPVAADTGGLALHAEHSFDDVQRADVLMIPGGNDGTARAAADERLTAWVRDIQATAHWTAWVRNGALILEGAGLMDRMKATTASTATDAPSEAKPLAEGVVSSDGISAGIDVALLLAEQLTDRETAEAIQFILQYDPRPNVESGAWKNASQRVRDRAKELEDVYGLREEGLRMIRRLSDS